MEDKGRYYFDIESSGLLDDSTVDYTSSPWKLRDNFVIHCIVATNIDTLHTVSFVQEECYTKFKPWVLDNVNEIVSHNGINFDMLVCKVALDMDYSVTPDSWCGKPVVVHDTLVLSKVLNPDRRGHSIEWFGKQLGFPKIDWRAKAVELGLIAWNAPKGAEFAVYHPAMRDYCEQDCLVGVKTFHYLMAEWGDWNWQDAYNLEKAIAEIIIRQAHRGFKFDSELALSNVKELDELMLERKQRVEPNLPEKPMGLTKQKEYLPSKNQFKLSGEPSANIIKWCAKHGGTVEQREDEGYFTTLYGKEYKLPIPQEPIVSTEPAQIDDTTFIKGVLVEMGWTPSQYKERDLTVDTKKQKLSEDKFVTVIDRYVKQTLASPFCKDRCAKLGVSPKMLLDKLKKHKLNKPLKVYTNPTFTIGQEKEIDPELEKLAEKFPYVQDIIEFLTYKHRRNSILGGGFDPEEDDEDEFESGFIPNVRTDGRIPTPADSLGCATGRMQHRVVANVPRVSSLYGANMRGLFGVDTDLCYQHAYDFASLEARIESHYCWRYDHNKEYCNSLLLEKPNDVHSVTARKISAMLKRQFDRTPAKSVKYACSYGAQAARIAKTIGCSLEDGEIVFNAFWEAAAPLAELKEAVTSWWKTAGEKKFIPGLDGRKIMTRAEHALLNSLFQSAGVICAKRTMFIQDRLTKERGYSVDFWRDDWKTKQYIQQLIAYHDEAQSEITKSLVKWKKFATKEDAKAFQAENTLWAGPIENEKGFFMGTSVADEILQEAIEQTNKYYKLKVPLAVEPQYGRNWKECH